MTITEFYDKIGGDYAAVLGRFGSEDMVQHFALKFPQDSSFAQLTEGIEKQDAEAAFRAAHTLKGVCSNLGFDNLFRPADALTEKLRGRTFESGYEKLYQDASAEYTRLIDAIAELQS